MGAWIRRTLSLALFFAFVWTGIGHCANWTLVYENGKLCVYVDSESLSFYGNEGDRYVSCRLMCKPRDTSNPFYVVESINVRENNLKCLRYDVIMYDSGTGEIVQSRNEKNKGWQKTNPGSNYESIFLKLFSMGKTERGGASGTGFFITPTHILTNYHVINGGKKFEILFKENKYEVEVFATDPNNDLAILKVSGIEGSVKPLPIANSRDVKEGSRVYTVGFPMPDQLGIRAKLSEGIINATSGYKDDMRLFQISVPVQPGNSGGPLLNNRGEVIGVVTSGLGFKFLYNTGVLPQNVNYALKSSNIINLSNNYQFDLTISNLSNERDAVQIMDICRDAVVYIEVK